MDHEQSEPQRQRVEFYGGYQVYSDSGIDLTLLRENLKLSVTSRWEQNLRALEAMEALLEAGRVRRQGTAPFASTCQPSRQD